MNEFKNWIHEVILFSLGLFRFFLFLMACIFSFQVMAQAKVVSLGCPVKASSIQSKVYAPAPVTDGRFERGPGKMWVSLGACPQWLVMDLREPQTFNRVVLGSSTWGTVIKAGRLEGSNLAGAWLNPGRDAYWTPITSFSFPNIRQETFSFAFQPVTYRYVRLLVSEGWNSADNVQITEWELDYSPLQLQSDKVGNVFPQGEMPTIRAQIFAPGDNLAWRVLDYWGREVQSGILSLADEGEGILNIPFLIPVKSPGYYELIATLLKGEETLAEQVLPFGVIPSRQRHSLSPLASDAAISWLVSPTKFKDIATLMQDAGLAWVRDRISWAEVEPERGVFNWGKYEDSVNAQTTAGVKISMAFHDAPKWAREPGHALPRPADMYHFAYEAGKHFAGRILAWEIWNEADDQFASAIDTPAYYAAVLKAAYLGFKSADPQIEVVMAGWAGNRVYPEQVLDNEVDGYFDVYNEHAHTKTERTMQDYPAQKVAEAQCLLNKQGLRQPLWVTEAGIGITAEKLLDKEQQTLQARYLVRSIVTSLSQGVAKHFYFLLPYYKEGTSQWGLLRDDLTPYPAYFAFANLINLLGAGKYLGTVQDLPPGVQGYIFADGERQISVLWSETATPITLPIPAATNLAVYNLMGGEETLTSKDNKLVLLVRPDPLFVVGRLPLTPAVPQTLKLEEKIKKEETSRVVPLLSCNLPYQKDRGYLFQGATPFQAKVEIDNFTLEDLEGIVSLEIPPGWTVSPAKVNARITARGKEVYSFTVQPRDLSEGGVVLKAKAIFGNMATSASVIHLQKDEVLAVKEEKPLSESLEGERWGPDNIEAGGKVELAIERREGLINLTFTFPGTNGGWAYPRLLFKPPQDWREWKGISFKIRLTESVATLMRVFVCPDDDGIPQNGEPMFFTPKGYTLQEEVGWYEIRLPFSELEWWSGSGVPPDGKIDLSRIGWLSIGVNHSEGGLMRLQIKEIKLFR